MLELFSNPGFLVAGGTLVSAPIIIHLINRMRFKRLRWAAMEFLIKAQKKSRRRLIIEQLLLLMLRCLLVLLTTLLVGRFLGFSFGSNAEQETLHVVLLDDTLSMADRWEDKDGPQDCFKAGKEFITKKIVDNLKQSNNVERLVLLPLSKLVTEPKFAPKIYSRLGDPSVADTIGKDLAELQPTKLHVDLQVGIDKARDYIKENPHSKIVVHVIGDFRKSDWAGAESRALHKQLRDMTKNQERVRVRLIDTVAPHRTEGQGGVPAARDNLAIVDFQAATRVAPQGKRVEFRVKVANFSTSEASVGLVIYNDEDGTEVLDADFKDRMPLVVPAMSTATVRFEKAFYSDPGKEDKPLYIRLAAHLVSPDRSALKNDGIAEDNVRHASVEIRSQVPLLLVDGRNEEGLTIQEEFKKYKDDKGNIQVSGVKVKKAGDSLVVSKSIEAFEGKRDPKSEKPPRYKVVLAHEEAAKLASTDGRKVLASPDLEKYQTIMLLDVPSLEEDQLARLEKYVRDGGGVAIFLGPEVAKNIQYYNQFLYNNGKGLFPVPLESDTIPSKNTPLEELPRNSKQFQLLLREDEFPSGEPVPIFGEFLKQDRNQINWLKHLPVRRYQPAQPRQNWKGEPGKVKEVFTRPNNRPIGDYVDATKKLVQALPRADRDDSPYKSYDPGLKRHIDQINKMIDPNNVGADKVKTVEQPAYLLADLLDEMLNDRGLIKDLKNYPNLTEFWNLPDPKIAALRSAVIALRQELRYSHPMLIVHQYGKGRVVAVMTTAGQEWNDWSGGITGDAIYAPILFEMQNYLSSQGGGSSKLVGPGDTVSVDASQYKKKKLRVERVFYRPEMGNKEKELEPQKAQAVVKKDDKKGDKKDDEDKATRDSPTQDFVFENTPEPGFALIKVFAFNKDEDAGVLVETRSRVYNVDGQNEGNLQRVTQADMESNLLREANAGRPAEDQLIRFLGAEDSGESLVARPQDLSQMPWFFLLFLAILVAEQALAVHLSFHLKGAEAEMPTLVARQQSRAA